MFIFKKKSKVNFNTEEFQPVEKQLNEIFTLKKQLYSEKKELINDFIRILEQIQQTNNENLQWKKRQCIINNETNLAIEHYRTKIMELDMNK